MSVLRGLFVALLLGSSGNALACSLAKRVPYTHGEIEEDYVRSFLRADSVVEILARRSETGTDGGSGIVLRVFKGPLEEGSLIEFGSVVRTSCDHFKPLGAGDRGIVLLQSNTAFPTFSGFLTTDALITLARKGHLRPRSAFR